MKRLIAPALITALIISGAALLDGKPASYSLFTGSPPKIDSILIDPASCKAKCERSKISENVHKHVQDENLSFNFSSDNMSMTFEKEVGIRNGYYLLKNNKFNGGFFNLDLTHALEPTMWSKSDAPSKKGSLKIIRFDTIGNDILKRRVIADFHAGDTTGRISFPATVTFSDSTNQKPARLQGNFVIDALVWKLYPVDTNATVTKDELNFILDIVSKKQ
jgi:hypothetical protein